MSSSLCCPPRAHLRTAVSAAALLGLSLHSPAWSQSAPAQATSLNPVVVTGTRAPIGIDAALAEVTVIDRADIDAATGRTLPELLARSAGVQFWSNGGLGKVSSVSLRGLESRHTLLLIDGVRYGSATVGTPSWDNLPLDAIERIEIVRGPLSGLYGSDAVGGVVQVFTRRGTPGFQPDAQLTIGTRGHAEAAAGLRFGDGRFDGSVRAQTLRTKGFSATNAQVPFGGFNADDDGFEQRSVQAAFGAQLGAWRAEAKLLQARSDSAYDDGPGADSLATLSTQVASLQLGGPVIGSWRTLVRISRSQDDLDTVRTASAFTPLGVTGTTSDQVGWENQLDTPIGRVIGLAEQVQQRVERPVQAYAVSERTVRGVALGLDGRSGMHSWQGNVRLDSNSQFGRQRTGALAYGLTLAPGLQATGSVGKSFVAPSFNQLYFPGFGNPNLLPEEGETREVALKSTQGAVTARMAYFDTRIRGYITSGPAPVNIPRTRIQGVSTSVDAQLGAWSLQASVDSLDPLNTTLGNANFGKTLPRRVRDSARLSADWREGAYSAGATLVANGERFDNAANTTRLAGYGTLDLRAEWAVSHAWRLGLRLNNATAKVYETVPGYNQPGREAFVTLRYAP